MGKTSERPRKSRRNRAIFFSIGEFRSVGSSVLPEGTTLTAAILSFCTDRNALISTTISARSRSSAVSRAMSSEILASICVIEKVGMHQNNNPQFNDLTHRSLIAVGRRRHREKGLPIHTKFCIRNFDDQIQARRVPRQRTGGFARVSGGGPARGRVSTRPSPAWARAGRLEAHEFRWPRSAGNSNSRSRGSIQSVVFGEVRRRRLRVALFPEEDAEKRARRI